MRAPRTNAAAWSAAGRQAGNQAIQMTAIARRSSPRYDKIAAESMNARAQEKIAATRAERHAKKADIQAETLEKRTDIEIDKFKAINAAKSTMRKAGMVAAAGQLAGFALTPDDEPIKPKTIDYSDSEQLIISMRDKARAELAAGANPYVPEKGTATAESGGTGGTAGSGATKAGGTAGKASVPASGKAGWKPLSAVIRRVEGTEGDKGYTTMYGGGQFSDTTRHPDTVITAGNYSSAAAGAYQFMPGTWKEAAAATGVTDFTPASQETAAQWLTTSKRGVQIDTPFANYDEFAANISKLSPEWAGLPSLSKGSGGYHGQGHSNMRQLWELYQQNL